MKTRANSGFAVLVYLVAVALVAAGVLVFKPRALHGDSKRADASVAASARVEAALTTPAAVAAASVAKIAEANSAAPASPSKDFIAREAPLALANLPPPDPQALLDAERRRAAVMEGQLTEARTLYDAALARADEANKEKVAALAARAKADANLETTAAARLAAEHEGNLYKLAGIAALVLYLYVKFTHFSPGSMATIVSDIRGGVSPITAIDTAASGLQQRLVSWLTHWKPPSPPPTQTT